LYGDDSTQLEEDMEPYTGSLYGEDSPPLEGEAYNELETPEPEPEPEIDPTGQSEDFSSGQSVEGIPTEQSVESSPEIESSPRENSIRTGIKDMIKRVESKGDYNAYNTGKSGVNRGKLDLQNMTLGEIRRRQKTSTKSKEHLNAVGAYQVIGSTLQQAMDSIPGVDKDTKYTKEVQEKIGDYLLNEKRPFVGKFMRGEVPDTAANRKKVQLSLSKEWAAIPTSGGKSYYAGDKAGNVAANISSDEFDKIFSGGTDEKAPSPPTSPESPVAPSPISTVPGQPSKQAPNDGAAGAMLRKHALKEPPTQQDIQNEYLNKLDRIYKSEAYINAPPEIRKEFLDQVAEPYRKLANLSKENKGMEINDFHKRTTEWGRNMRSMMNAEIREATRKSNQSGRVKTGQILSKVQTKIRSLSQFRNNLAKAKGSKKKELLSTFAEYAKEQDQEGMSGGIQRLFNFDPQETVLDQDKLNKMLNILYSEEKHLMNNMMGSGTKIFDGISEDIVSEETKASEDNDFNDSIDWDDEG